MEDEYLGLENIGKVEVNIKHSIFIGLAYPLEGKNYQDILREIKLEYPSATHYCWAYRKLPREEYFSDGGEPSGSAGRPILNSLREFNLWNSMVVVVRYFGGVKLGVKGLISAYYSTSKSAILAGRIVKKHITADYILSLPYNLLNNVKNDIYKNFTKEVDMDFHDKVILKIRIPLSKKEEFENYLLRKEGIEIVKNS
ncbi:MAG: thymidylate synthase [Dictyoglomus sp. NZ13-RE01]|nr:MAG: thymidylate synthase [Dictyoglomus sp. NZ13-RE01]